MVRSWMLWFEPPKPHGEQNLLMELTCVASVFIGPVASFTLPKFDVQSSVDVSDHSLTNSLQNSSVNTFEFSLNLTSVTLGAQVLLLRLVFYLFRNISAALLVLNNKLNSLAVKYGKRQERSAVTQVQSRPS